MEKGLHDGALAVLDRDAIGHAVADLLGDLLGDEEELELEMAGLGRMN